MMNRQRYTYMKLCYIFVVLALVFSGCSGHSINDTDTLMANLLQGYNKHSTPIENQSESLQITMGAYLLSIEDFNEIEERLSGVYAFYFIWTDFKMSWDPALYNYTPYFFIDYREVWVPDFVVLLNPSDGMSTLGGSWQKVWYHSNGLANWYPGGNLKTTCPVNVAKYPFDTQTCSLMFMTWYFTMDIVNLTSSKDTMLMDFYAKNSIWEVTQTESRTEFFDQTQMTSRMVFTIHLKRRSGFVVVSVIVPVLFLSMLNLLVFVLPMESGERVSYSITCLLSIAVFMTIVSDTLPKNSDPVAIIAYVLMVELGVSGIITMSTILIMKLYYMADEKKMPNFMTKLIQKKSINAAVAPGALQLDHQGGQLGIDDLTGTDACTEKDGNNEQRSKHCEIAAVSWRDLSVFLDKVCFIVFLSVTVIVYVVYFVLVLN